MPIKHKVLKDFQLLTDDKKILILKAKTLLEDYKFKNKSEFVKVPSEIIKNNPDYFAFIDWKEELQNFLKTNKIPQPAVITKKIVPFIESLLSEYTLNIKEVVVEKEIQKEIIIEKPTIVEKEILVENSNSKLEIELENKLKKLKLKEEQLDKEIDEANKKELECINLEKKLKELETKLSERSNLLESKENDLINLQKILSEKEEQLSHKESNLSDYLSKTKISQNMDRLRAQGFNLDLYETIFNES